MKTLRWIAVVGAIVAGASLVACGSDDDDDTTPPPAGGSGGGTGGEGGDATGGTAGDATGGSAGDATGGTAGDGGAGGAAAQPLDSPCIQACIADNPDEWKLLIDAVAPCVCTDDLCGTECETTWCADPIVYEAPDACGNCGLNNGQTSCMNEMGACLGNPDCAPVVSCLLACVSG